MGQVRGGRFCWGGLIIHHGLSHGSIQIIVLNRASGAMRGGRSSRVGHGDAMSEEAMGVGLHGPR